MAARQQADPRFETQMFGSDRLLRQEIIQHRSQVSRADTQIIRIPVVFHIMHQLGLENIGDHLIHREIDRLNDAFRNRGFYDQGKGLDIHIEFCLANVDPQGQSTTGIERIRSLDYTDLNSRGDNWDMRRQHNWDPERYLNIYTNRKIVFLIGFDTVNVIATAIYPTDAGTGIDAISIRSDQIGILNQPEESTVLVHEVGHYLGLFHTYKDGCPNYDCMIQGDRVCDTPPDSRSVIFEGCISHNNCATDADDLSGQNPYWFDVPDLNNLYLDYNDYSCRNAFTPGQRERMRAALRVFRPKLGNNYVCHARSGPDLALFPSSDNSRIVCDPSYSPQLRLFNFGDQAITDFKLNVFQNQNFVFTQFYTNNIPSRGFIDIPIPNFNLAAGQHEIGIVVDEVNGQNTMYPDNDEVSWLVNFSEATNLPIRVDFEQEWPESWPLYNPRGTGFERLPYACDPQNGNEYCIGIQNRFFYDTGVEDGFYSPIIDLSAVGQAQLKFDLAYSMEDQVTLLHDELMIAVSTDCGLNFDPPIYDKNRYGIRTHHRWNDTISNWIPATCAEWSKDSVDLSAYAGQEIVLRFIFSKFQNGNPLYLDNLEITGGPGMGISPELAFDFHLLPLPKQSLIQLQLEEALDAPATLHCYDLQGKELQTWELKPSALRAFDLALEGYASGIYIFSLVSEKGALFQKKILRGM